VVWIGHLGRFPVRRSPTTKIDAGFGSNTITRDVLLLAASEMDDR